MSWNLMTLADCRLQLMRAAKEWEFAEPLGGLHGRSVQHPVELVFPCAPVPSWTTWVAKDALILQSSRSKSACSQIVRLQILKHPMRCAQPPFGAIGVPAAQPVDLECELGLVCLQASRPRRQNVNAGWSWMNRDRATNVLIVSLLEPMHGRSARKLLIKDLAGAVLCDSRSTRTMDSVRHSPMVVVVAIEITLWTARTASRPAAMLTCRRLPLLNLQSPRVPWIVSCPSGRVGPRVRAAVISGSPPSTVRFSGNPWTADSRVDQLLGEDVATWGNVNYTWCLIDSWTNWNKFPLKFGSWRGFLFHGHMRWCSVQGLTESISVADYFNLWWLDTWKGAL